MLFCAHDDHEPFRNMIYIYTYSTLDVKVIFIFHVASQVLSTDIDLREKRPRLLHYFALPRPMEKSRPPTPSTAHTWEVIDFNIIQLKWKLNWNGNWIEKIRQCGVRADFNAAKTFSHPYSTPMPMPHAIIASLGKYGRFTSHKRPKQSTEQFNAFDECKFLVDYIRALTSPINGCVRNLVNNFIQEKWMTSCEKTVSLRDIGEFDSPRRSLQLSMMLCGSSMTQTSAMHCVPMTIIDGVVPIYFCTFYWEHTLHSSVYSYAENSACGGPKKLGLKLPHL